MISDIHNQINTNVDQSYHSDIAEIECQDNRGQTSLNMLELAIYIDKKSPHKMFDNTVAKLYRDKIISKNEDFFLDEQYNTAYNDINLINKLKTVWKTIDNSNKEIIWQYMNVLLILNDRCHR